MKVIKVMKLQQYSWDYVFEKAFLCRDEISGLVESYVNGGNLSKEDAKHQVKKDMHYAYIQTYKALRRILFWNNYIYRAIHVENYQKFKYEILKEGKHIYNGRLSGVGIHWTYEVDRACNWFEPENTKKECVILAVVVINKKGIDVDYTFELNLAFDDEKEIRLECDTLLSLRFIKYFDKDSNKIFVDRFPKNTHIHS